MPDPTHPKTPTDEPKTDSTPKESIRPAQEEFVGDEAQPSRDRSEYEPDQGSQSSDRGVEDGQLPGGGGDGGSRSSDRAVEDASLPSMAADTAAADEEDDEDDLGEDDDLEDLGDEEDIDDPDEAVADEELSDDETETTPEAAHVLVGA